MSSQKVLSQEEAYKEGAEHQFIESLELGPWTSYSLLNDPRHMGFVLARYKFCAKMLEGKQNVLEVGCGDAFGTPVVAQTVGQVYAIEPEPRHIEENPKRLAKVKNISFTQMNICEATPDETFDAAYSIDVIEHLDPHLNDSFIENQVKVLKEDGVCIIGTPNITSEQYASERSRVQHINLKSHKTLKADMEKYFRNVFMFSMNDEVLHTGYEAMGHYVFAMGVGLK